MHYIGSPAASSGPEFKTIARKEPVTTEEKVQTGHPTIRIQLLEFLREQRLPASGFRNSSVTPSSEFCDRKKPKKPKSTVKYSQDFIPYSY
jgi:hypothetical protein